MTVLSWPCFRPGWPSDKNAVKRPNPSASKCKSPNQHYHWGSWEWNIERRGEERRGEERRGEERRGEERRGEERRGEDRRGCFDEFHLKYYFTVYLSPKTFAKKNRFANSQKNFRQTNHQQHESHRQQHSLQGPFDRYSYIYIYTFIYTIHTSSMLHPYFSDTLCGSIFSLLTFSKCSA